MSEEMDYETEQHSLRRILSEDRVREVVADLAALPGRDEFIDNVERDLWKTVAGPVAEGSDSVQYQELPEESQAIIGAGEEDGEKFLPWWFFAFDWTFEAHGETLVLNSIDKLDQLGNFDLQATTISRPSLSDDIETGEDLPRVLDALATVQEALSSYVDVDETIGGNNMSVSLNIFEIENNKLSTTEGFKSWFQDVYELCPPCNEVLTGLLMVDTNVNRETAESIWSPELLDRLDDLGYSGEQVHADDYYEALKTTVELSVAFDRHVPRPMDLEGVEAFEELFYDAWARKHQDQKKEIGQWMDRVGYSTPNKIETGDQQQFAKVALRAPLRIAKGNLVYTTAGVRKGGRSYTSNGKDTSQAVAKIMDEYGYTRE